MEKDPGDSVGSGVNGKPPQPYPSITPTHSLTCFESSLSSFGLLHSAAAPRAESWRGRKQDRDEEPFSLLFLLEPRVQRIMASASAGILRGREG